MEQLQKAVKNFLAYWFVLGSISELSSADNVIEKIAIASFGFVFVMIAVPFVLNFFKLDERNTLTYTLFAIGITLIYTFFLKPGIVGLIYFPENTVLLNIQSDQNILRLEISQFGIIIMVSVLSILISLFIDKKIK